MNRPKLIIDMAELPKFDSLEEALVYAAVDAYTKDGEWRHTAYTREIIAKRVKVAEITVKVMLRSLLKKGALAKPRKAVYTIVDGFLSKPETTPKQQPYDNFDYQ